MKIISRISWRKLRTRMLLLPAAVLLVSAMLAAYPQQTEAAYPGDNGRILINTNREGGMQLWTMNTNGSGLQRITPTDMTSCCGTISGNGQVVAFQRGDGNIWRVNINGSGLQQLTNDAFFDNAASISPDGTRILYNSFRDEQREIRLMSASGGGSSFIGIGTGPSWAPDGQRFAYMTQNGEVAIRDLNTGTTTLVVTGDGVDAPGDWTPDGSGLLYFHELEGVQGWYLLDLDTGSSSQIPNLGTPNSDGSVSISPDGDKLLFQSERASTDGSAEVFTMNLDGSGVTRLTNSDAFNGASDWQPIPSTGDIKFEWTVPDRLQANSDNLIQNYPPIATTHPSALVDPTVGVLVDFPVDFEVIKESDEPCDESLTYTWKVDGQVVDMTQDGCNFRYVFEEEKSYEVTVEATGTEPFTDDVTINDILIFSLGDSVAAGEGNPENTPIWKFEPCHRSAWAGPAQAALALERQSDKTSVTFVHLACTGATGAHGLFGTYRGRAESALNMPLPSQVDQVAMATGATTNAQGVRIPQRTIDKVFMSLGANDIGFAPIVRTCGQSNDCQNQLLRGVSDNSSASRDYWIKLWNRDPSIQPGDRLSDVVRRKLNDLPTMYRAVDACLGGGTTVASCRLNAFLGASLQDLVQDAAYRNAIANIRPVAFDSADIVITDYFDPTKERRNNQIVTCNPVVWFPVGFGEFSQAEGTWAARFILNGPNLTHLALNQRVSQAASQHGWQHVGGVAAAFAPHGYCTGTNSWIVSISEGLATGSAPMHPNELGQQYYGQRLLPFAGN